jgi:hypothetical protein
MHAYHGNGSDGLVTVDEIQMNHGMATMSFTFRARIDAGLTAYAA